MVAAESNAATIIPIVKPSGEVWKEGEWVDIRLASDWLFRTYSALQPNGVHLKTDLKNYPAFGAYLIEAKSAVVCKIINKLRI